MAKLDDLIAQIEDARLRGELKAATDELRQSKAFGLVFEEHIPETTVLHGFPIRRGATVFERTDRALRSPLVVRSTKGTQAVVTSRRGAEKTVDTAELLVLKGFGDPIYPALTSVGAIRRAAPGRAAHMILNGENFHALQLLIYLYEGMVDCIYIDPPYNTGARDWTYNNRYVDDSDTYRHSKWLSMMEKRLRLAKRLLKRDSVMVVTIDEHEVNHLGVLLEQIFPSVGEKAAGDHRDQPFGPGAQAGTRAR